MHTAQSRASIEPAGLERPACTQHQEDDKAEGEGGRAGGLPRAGAAIMIMVEGLVQRPLEHVVANADQVGHLAIIKGCLLHRCHCGRCHGCQFVQVVTDGLKHSETPINEGWVGTSHSQRG